MSPLESVQPSMSASSAGSFARLPGECLDAIMACLPPNCIPLAMRQLSKGWRQRFLLHTGVTVSGARWLPAWAVLAQLPHVDPDCHPGLMTALARRGDLGGMQQLAQHLAPVATCDRAGALYTAARIGRLDIVCWLVDHWGCWCHCTGPAAFHRAAQGGHVHVLQFLREQLPMPTWPAGVLAAAAKGGHVYAVAWLRNNGCGGQWSAWVAAAAAAGGHLEMLRYLREHGCPWAVDACSAAAAGGHLEVLRYLRDSGCPWDQYACASAAEGGHWEVLRYLRDTGCPWDAADVLARAVKGGAPADVLQYIKDGGAEVRDGLMGIARRQCGLHTVQWLHGQGCGTFAWNCSYAAEYGRLNILRYLMQHGCPYYSGSLYYAAALHDRREVLLWLREQGHEWTAEVCPVAAEQENVPLLQWLREQSPPCPWDASVVHAVLAGGEKEGQAQCLEHLLSHDCPWAMDDYRAAQQSQHLKHVQWPGVRRSQRLRR